MSFAVNDCGNWGIWFLFEKCYMSFDNFHGYVCERIYVFAHTYIYIIFVCVLSGAIFYIIFHYVMFQLWFYKMWILLLGNTNTISKSANAKSTNTKYMTRKKSRFNLYY